MSLELGEITTRRDAAWFWAKHVAIGEPKWNHLPEHIKMKGSGRILTDDGFMNSNADKVKIVTDIYSSKSNVKAHIYKMNSFLGRSVAVKGPHPETVRYCHEEEHGILKGDVLWVPTDCLYYTNAEVKDLVKKDHSEPDILGDFENIYKLAREKYVMFSENYTRNDPLRMSQVYSDYNFVVVPSHEINEYCSPMRVKAVEYAIKMSKKHGRVIFAEISKKDARLDMLYGMAKLLHKRYKVQYKMAIKGSTRESIFKSSMRAARYLYSDIEDLDLGSFYEWVIDIGRNLNDDDLKKKLKKRVAKVKESIKRTLKAPKYHWDPQDTVKLGQKPRLSKKTVVKQKSPKAQVKIAKGFTKLPFPEFTFTGAPAPVKNPQVAKTAIRRSSSFEGSPEYLELFRYSL